MAVVLLKQRYQPVCSERFKGVARDFFWGEEVNKNINLTFFWNIWSTILFKITLLRRLAMELLKTVLILVFLKIMKKFLLKITWWCFLTNLAPWWVCRELRKYLLRKVTQRLWVLCLPTTHPFVLWDCLTFYSFWTDLSITDHPSAIYLEQSHL